MQAVPASSLHRSAVAPGLAGLVAALLATAPVAASADGELLERVAESAAAARSVAAFETPRLTRTELAPSTPLATLPGYRSESSELDYRWWASKGRAAVGLGVGTFVESQRPVAPSPAWRDDAVSAHATATILTLGLRYRTTEHSAFYADASGVRGMPGVNDDRALVGKVGVEFKAAQSRWNIAYGGLGLHLNGDTRMTLRVRKGGVAIYMRSKF